jgi:hypothetical protein
MIVATSGLQCSPIYGLKRSMSTLFPQMVVLSLLFGCAGAAPPPQPAASSAPQEREWKSITVSGPYGTFDVAVPVVSISTAQNGVGSIVIDSVALVELEKRLTSRIAHIARAQAAALMVDTSETRFISRNPAPSIKPGLIGMIPFELNDIEPTAEGKQRIAAASVLLNDLPGMIQITTVAHGTGGTQFGIANARASRVYLDLLAAEPRLARREVVFTVRTEAVLPGAPVPDPVVEVYYSRP